MDEYHRQLFHKEREAAGLPEGNAPQKSARGKEGALDPAGAGEGRARKGSASKGAPKMAEEGEFGQVKKKGKSGEDLSDAACLSVSVQQPCQSAE